MSAPTARVEAAYAALNGAAVSEGAQGCVKALASGLEYHEQVTTDRVNRRAEKTRDKLTSVVGAFLMDLLVAAARPETEGWVYRPMRSESFSDLDISIKTFRPVVRMMLELGYLEAHEENAISSSAKTKAARWRATEKLLRLVAARDITPANVLEHFQQRLPDRPLVLRAPKQGKGKRKVQGKRINFAPTPHTRHLEADLKRLNAFLDTHKLQGGHHRGYTRIFNNGTIDGYQWNQGGRLYSLCQGSYQSMGQDSRLQMRIDEESVAEIDVRASYLTVLHGLTGQPFDVAQDAYDLEGLVSTPLGNEWTRWAAKKWAVALLGNGDHSTKWSPDTAQEFQSLTGHKLGKVYPLCKIREAMELKHPVFKDWGKLGLSWGELMFHESEAMLGCMLELMDDHAIPSLTVHDSLIVRDRDVAKAQEALKRHYKRVCGLEPFVVVKAREPMLSEAA